MALWLCAVAALPLADSEYPPDNHLTVDDVSAVAKEAAVEEYFANLNLELMLGEPDENTGRVYLLLEDSLSI